MDRICVFSACAWLYDALKWLEELLIELRCQSHRAESVSDRLLSDLLTLWQRSIIIGYSSSLPGSPQQPLCNLMIYSSKYIKLVMRTQFNILNKKILVGCLCKHAGPLRLMLKVACLVWLNHPHGRCTESSYLQDNTYKFYIKIWVVLNL